MEGTVQGVTASYQTAGIYQFKYDQDSGTVAAFCLYQTQGAPYILSLDTSSEPWLLTADPADLSSDIQYYYMEEYMTVDSHAGEVAPGYETLSYFGSKMKHIYGPQRRLYAPAVTLHHVGVAVAPAFSFAVLGGDEGARECVGVVAADQVLQGTHPWDNVAEIAQPLHGYAQNIVVQDDVAGECRLYGWGSIGGVPGQAAVGVRYEPGSSTHLLPSLAAGLLDDVSSLQLG